MKKSAFVKKNFFYLFVGILLIFSACDDNEAPMPDNEAPGTSINKIMPLGASRVEGARPAFESFRYELWKLMIDGEWEFDYIGTMEDDAAYPAFAGADFDTDHEGRGGYTSGQILAGINGWLDDAGAPDIVLFSSPGGNDALEGLPYDQAISNINEVIDAIQAANPEVTVIIEQLAPARTDLATPELVAYMEQLRQDVLTIATDQTTATSQVIPVDMYTGFSDAFLADDVHYNEAGARFIADRYYTLLVDILQE